MLQFDLPCFSFKTVADMTNDKPVRPCTKTGKSRPYTYSSPAGVLVMQCKQIQSHTGKRQASQRFFSPTLRNFQPVDEMQYFYMALSIQLVVLKFSITGSQWVLKNQFFTREFCYCQYLEQKRYPLTVPRWQKVRDITMIEKNRHSSEECL